MLHVSFFRLRPVALVAICLLLTALLVPAQTINGSISGKVSDTSGAFMPNVKITVINLETGIARDVETDETGIYRIRALPIGQYSLTFAATGFEKQIRKPIDVRMSVDISVDIVLKPGVSQTVVDVTAEAPLIEATQSQLSKGVEKAVILELPGLNSLTGLALLQAGAVNNQNGRPGSGFAVNGGRTRSNNFTIDGANNNDQSLSIPRLNLVPEYIDQFRIITNNFSAEYGRNSGAYVSQLTRSGTNAFHGIARWTWQGNGFNGLTTGEQRTFNTFKAQGLSDGLAMHKARAVVVENLGVGSFGGPIKKDKSFFFVGYDVDRYRTTAVPTTIAIAPAGYDLLNQYKSSFAPGTVDFLQKTFPVANDPTSRGSITVAVPNAANIVIPLQQLSPGLTSPLSYGRNSWRWIFKNDTKISSKNSLTTRYVLYDYADPGAPTALAVQRVGQNNRDQSLTANDTHVFSPTVLNEARITFTRRGIQFPENFPQYFSIAGFNSVGNTSYPQHRTDNGYEYTDNLSWIHGRHTVKTGFNLYHVSLDSFFPANLLGSVTYTSLSDFLLDKQATFSKYSGQLEFTAPTNELGAFFQDDFRVKPNFTLNLGLRYEYDTAPLGYWANAKPDINNFGPRVGFAWSPQANDGVFGKLFGMGKTSLRGGFGMTYDQIFQNVLLNVFRNYPRGINYPYGPVDGKALFLQANQPKVPTPQEYAASGLNIDALDQRNWSPNTRIAQPYTLQFTFGIERQLYNNWAVKVFYIGTRGVKLMRERETNYGFLKTAVDANPSAYSSIINTLTLAQSTPGASGAAYRINPAIGGRAVGAGIAMSTYHSLQTTLEKRLTHGLTFQANYTYSSFINDNDDILGGTTNNTIAAVPFNFKLEKARSGLDQPHRLVINYVYQVPFFKEQKGVIGRILGGYELAGITTESSGTPYTIFNANNALGIIPSSQLTLLSSSQRPSINVNGVPGTATAAGVTNPYYIANAQNSGIIGTLGRNTMRAGGTNNFDVSVVKNIRITGEKQALQLRWEVFDVMAHRNFTTYPAATVSNSTNQATFLNLGQTNVAGRSMWLGLRYSF
jgi:hypothetical protein